jgi:hypothetical protein
MALTINPAVSGGHKRWLSHGAAFFVGVWFGGLIALAGLLILVGVAGQVVSVRWLAVSAAATMAYAALHDLGLPLPLPYRNRQVPEWLRDVLPGGLVAAVFGAMLGVGFLTLFTYSTHLAVLLALPFLSSAWAMVAGVAVFAAGKTLVLVGVIGAESLDDVPVHWDPRRIAVLRVATATASLLLAAALVVHE